MLQPTKATTAITRCTPRYRPRNNNNTTTPPRTATVTATATTRANGNSNKTTTLTHLHGHRLLVVALVSRRPRPPGGREDAVRVRQAHHVKPHRLLVTRLQRNSSPKRDAHVPALVRNCNPRYEPTVRGKGARARQSAAGGPASLKQITSRTTLPEKPLSKLSLASKAC